MDEIKNENTATEAENIVENEEIVESEEVLEVALSDDSADSEDGEEKEVVYNGNGNSFEYTEGEMSGLTEKQRRRKMIFDKITTGILIALLASPVAIILYIFLWFILR